jgi:hypothetical protein
VLGLKNTKNAKEKNLYQKKIKIFKYFMIGYVNSDFLYFEEFFFLRLISEKLVLKKNVILILTVLPPWREFFSGK